MDASTSRTSCARSAPNSRGLCPAPVLAHHRDIKGRALGWLEYRLISMAIPNSYDILQAVIEATPDAIFVKDLQGRYVLVNEAVARFLGKSPAEIVGKHDLELYPEETARRFIEDDRYVLSTGKPHAFEGVATSETGTQAYLVTRGVYRDKDGQILGSFGISHDIT